MQWYHQNSVITTGLDEGFAKKCKWLKNQDTYVFIFIEI